jgi:transposase
VAVSTTSKSPKDILLTALSVGQAKLSDYSHRNSPRKFTQPQLFACLVLKTSLGLDYRGLEGLLDDSADLCQLIGLESVPHYTTFQKASRKLLANALAQSLLDETVRRALGRRKSVEHAAIDSTGLECTAASNYFVKRRVRAGNPWKTVTYTRYPKLAIVCRTNDHFILAFSSRRGPKPDVDEFKELASVAAKRAKLRCIVADAGYDSESNHRFARETLASRSIFPAKHGRPTRKPASGKYRRLMQVRFDLETYRKRVQVETVVSMIKRRLGNHVRARSRWGQVRELALVVLTHNLMILWCSILFYRSGQASLFSSEADAAGAVELKQTIGGTFGETLWLGTEGRHVYDEWLYDSYVQGTAREIRTGEYDSSGFVWTDTARSSTVTGQYDPDGKLLSASGSLRQQIESGGMFWAEDHEDATRTFGDWEAIRGYERTSSDRFRSSLARDWTPPTRPLPSSPRPLPCLSACPHASPRFCGKSPATGEPQVQVPTTSRLPVSPASRLRDSDRCLTPGGTTAICFSAAYLRWHCISTKCNRSPAPNIGRSQPASL